MRRFAVLSSVWVLCLLAIAGCGGGKKKTATSTPTTITISPASLSLEQGKFAQPTATVKDQNGNALSGQKVTWSTSNAAVADVTPATGAICGGTWNSTTTPTVCNPTAPGTAVITATSGSLTATLTVTVTPHVARIEVSPMTGVCLSQGEKQQFTATAFDAGNNPITGITAANFSWSSDDATVATVDANGMVAGGRPGLAHINAVLTNAFGVPVDVITCPPQSISLGTQGVTPLEMSFQLAPTNTKTLQANITDSKGNPISDIALTYASTNIGVAGVSGSGRIATATGNAAGIATIVASCTPPLCNPRVNQPVYSNPVTVFVSGTSTPKVVVTGKDATQVVVIDNNAVTATVTLPQINGATPKPNSILISPDGATAYIGSDLGVLRFDLGNNTFGTSSNIAAFTLAASTGNARLLTSDIAGRAVAYNISTGFIPTAFAIPGIVAADFSIDQLKALATTSSQLYVYDVAGNVMSPVGAIGGSQILYIPQSSLALVSNAGSGTMVATCNYQSTGSAGTVGTLLAKSHITDRVWGADGSNIYEVNIVPQFDTKSTPTTIDCRPNVTLTPTARSLGASVTPVQLIATPNSQFAYLINSTGTIYQAKAGQTAVTPITLVNGAGRALSGDATPDSASVYVGTTVGDVHRIDVATATDVQQIQVNLKRADGSGTVPDLVAVRPR